MDKRHDVGDDEQEASVPPVGSVPVDRRFPSSNIGRPRIQGVEAGVAAGLVPASGGAPGEAGTGTSTNAPRHLSRHAVTSIYDEEPVPDEISQGVELPDWTDPPTQQVPRVLLRPGSETGRTIPGPVWRESGRDFDEDREAFADLVSESVPIVAHEDSGDDDDFGYGDETGAPSESGDEDEPEEPPKPGVRFAGRVVTIGRAQTAGPPVNPPLGRPETKEKGSGGGRNLVVATATGILVGGVALIACLIGPAAVLALAAVVLLLAAAECFQAFRKGRYNPATLLGLVAAPGFAIAAYTKGLEAIPVLVALSVVGTVIWYLAGTTKTNVLSNMSVTVFGIMWIAGLGAFAGLLLDPAAFPNRHGIAFLLGAIEATVAYDVGGLAFGSLFGRHKLAPDISPNKTWEGLFGGSLAAILVALVITSQMHPWTLSRAAALGVVVAVVAPLGDLAESLVKRDLNLKDMGSLLPAHGGILDRVDALLFVLPATYILVRLFHG